MAGKRPSAKLNLGATKAKQILSDGTVRGNPLTAKQKGLFGAIAGGAPTATQGPGAAAPAPKPRKPPLAIGQRPALGARTKAAMKAKGPPRPRY